MIESCITNEARLAFLQGKIKPSHRFKIALYTKEAELGKKTKVYTPVNEVIAQGYTRLQVSAPVFEIINDKAQMGFSGAVVWDDVTISADGCMIFDADLDNLAIVIGSFGDTISSTNHKFEVNLAKDLIVFP